MQEDEVYMEAIQSLHGFNASCSPTIKAGWSLDLIICRSDHLADVSELYSKKYKTNCKSTI